MSEKRKRGDRRDAKRLKLPGLMQCCIDLKPTRMENEVYIDQMMDVTALKEYIEKKNAEGVHYTYFHAFMTAIGKVIYNRPKLNRFITNRHLYEHNEITLSFVAKMTLDDKSEELMLIIPIKPDDTIDSIKECIAGKVNNLRTKKENVEHDGAQNGIDVLCNLPNILRVPIFGLIKFLDKHDWIPFGLTNDLIYYSSMIVSNLGSIKCGAIYHNLANFGSCSSLATIGEIKPVKVLKEDGSEEIRQMCEFGITLDERIADGFYFAKSAKMIEYILNHPELLEHPANEKIEVNL